ncbi:LacI family DNA-binding transcriptional regulator [Anaerotalea alkaliphila]|uniref:LacI family transcriptional regulator n=1 Tax=Anaerotalea alkaliphila TaxID=2662126 RepID=A0A7X5HX90_9FIRM|nr:LacI family DNA-binding transcriptional regulator [Anaerotalea alkaliphila]NDL68301.1 LacI family transcriptional regulator [Anaerotalea alkaliphila]
MAVTIKDIAQIAGVSYSTVSRCLNDSNLVSPATKEKVKAIARDMGFEFNVHARGLTSNRKGTVGIIYPEDMDAFGVEMYFITLTKELKRWMDERETDLILSYCRNRTTGKNNIRRLVSQQKVDGLLIAEPDIDEETLHFLKESGIPFIFFHEAPAGTPGGLRSGIDRFTVDHVRGGWLATRHLLEHGCRRVFTITSDEEEFRLRTAGCRKALEESGVPFREERVLYGNQDLSLTSRLVRDISRVLQPDDGLFVQSDMMAWTAMETLKSLGFRIPEDISVIGYDDIDMGNYTHPRLTTIKQPRAEMAEAACKRLFDLLEGKGPQTERQVLFQPVVVERDSCRMNQPFIGKTLQQ